MIKSGISETAVEPSQNAFIAMVQIVSFLAVLCLCMNFYLVLVLNSYFPLVSGGSISGGVVVIISLFSFVGVFVSSLLCPFFLPSPGYAAGLPKNGKPVKEIAFILSIVLPNVIIRSMGVELWINSLPAKALVQILTGMLYPICIGLFLQTHIMISGGGKENRTGKFCSFFFALAFSGGIFSRLIFLSLHGSAGSGPLRVMALAYNLINALIIFIGVFTITWIVLTKNAACVQALPEQDPHETKANWQIIFPVIGLAVIFKFLNSVMEMRLFPGMNYSPQSFDIHSFVQGIAVPLITLLAYRSVNRFLKMFIPAAMGLFVLLPCLLFFEDYPRFIMFMDILLRLFNILIWVIFTVTLIEHYSGGLWFFILSSAIHLTNIFSFISPMILRYIPKGTGNIILICGISSVLSVILSIRILLLKNQFSPPAPARSSLEDIFRQYRLTEREMRVAALVVEGYENEEIANRIFRATITIKTHLTNIYKKFGVKGRTEFMAMVLRKLQTDDESAGTKKLSF